MAADKRTDLIIAIIDDGSFSFDDVDSITNPGFLICLEEAITQELEDIKNYSGYRWGVLWDSKYPQSSSEVACLMRYLGVSLRAKYSSDGTIC